MGVLHMARQYEEELAFLSDLGIAEGLVMQQIITHNTAYQADDLDAYDSDCDDISIAKAVFMENLFNYGSDVLSEDAPTFIYLHEVSEFQAQVQAKDTVIRKLKYRIKMLSETDNGKKVKKDLDEMEILTLTVENADLKTQLHEKDFVITSLKNDLRKLKGKDIVTNAAQISKATTIAPGMDLVKHARALRPLDSDLDSSCKYTKRILEVLVYITKTCPSSSQPSEKKIVVTPINKKRTTTFAEPIASISAIKQNTGLNNNVESNHLTLTFTRVKDATKTCRSKPKGNTRNDRIVQSISRKSKNKVEDQVRTINFRINKVNSTVEPKCNSDVKHYVLNAKSYVTCAICCLFDVSHDNYVLEFVNGVTKPTKSKIARKKKITPTQVVPLKEPTPKTVELKKLESANSLEPNQSWGSSTSVVPSCSSLFNDRLPRLFSVKFVNDQIAKIMGYDDYQMRNVTISRVYYVEGLKHNLFSVGQFCDSDLKNFGGMNHLARQGLVRGLPKLKFEKDHLCSACLIGKRKKQTLKPKSKDTNQEPIYLLHMDLYGLMHVASVNGKRYILVIVDDYSRFTWVKLLHSKDEAPEFIKKFLKMIQV
ncbi:retrovirus-related pol polyprotein from transposon TNT 1-94 [Tanacetum coccineum]